jgi:hypothetical protein
MLPAAVVPAAVCGVGLMLYNWLRFQSVFEFGLRYQLAGESLLHLRPIQPGLLWPHLHEYLFGAGVWSGYFPFFENSPTLPYGFLRYLVWGWLAPFAFLRVTRPAQPAGSGLRGFSAVVLAVVLGNLLLLGSYFYTVERYACDFTSTWLLLSGIGGLALSQRAYQRGRRWYASVGGIMAGLAVASLLAGLAVFASQAPRQGPLLALARAANWPRSVWRQVRGQEEGALRLTLELDRVSPAGLSVPLFETGRSAAERDWLQLDLLPDHRARVSFHHAGLPGFPGTPFQIPANGRLVIDARCGSLLPPFDHPAFAGWSRDDYEAARRDLQVSVNGVECLRGLVYCFDSSPDDLTVGRLAWAADGVAAQFPGRILGIAHRPPERVPSAPSALRSRRPVTLTLRLPLHHGPGGDPILITGHGNRSDLLYCRYEGDGRIRFALDHFGGGGPQSQAFAPDPEQPHRLTVWMGSLAEPEGTSAVSSCNSMGAPSSTRRRGSIPATRERR